jgi:hypothetical protein
MTLCRNSEANARAASISSTAGASFFQPILLEHEEAPAATGSQTYSVRSAGWPNSISMNAIAGARYMGGSSGSTLTLEEIMG